MPKFTVQIPVETTLYGEVEADSAEEAVQIVDADTFKYISQFSDNYDTFEFDHRGEIEAELGVS